MSEAVDRLVEIMARLRGPGGCPWDREQTFRSLRPYVLEEAFEVAEAIDRESPAALREELGDLLLQVVFLSRLAEEEGLFTLDDVAEEISAKLVRRHPHVFGDRPADSVGEVWKRWEEIKREEREGKREGSASRLDGIPRALPALVRARLLADKAARAGYDWPDAPAIVDKVREETEELAAVLAGGGGPGAAEEELGDLLFAAASLARRLGLDPEGALARANAKFEERFREAERLAREAGRELEEMDPDELDALWRRVKERR